MVPTMMLNMDCKQSWPWRKPSLILSVFRYLNTLTCQDYPFLYVYKILTYDTVEYIQLAYQLPTLSLVSAKCDESAILFSYTEHLTEEILSGYKYRFLLDFRNSWNGRFTFNSSWGMIHSEGKFKCATLVLIDCHVKIWLPFCILFSNR